MNLKIENRKYAYLGMNVVALSAVLNVYNGDDVVDSFGLSANYNITEVDFVQEITRQITVQVSEYMQKLMELDALRQARMPESTDFVDAVNRIFDPIQAAIGG